MDLHRLFHPRSVAVVGASPNLGDGKLPFYQLFKAAGYEGRLYAVNPAHTEIEGDRVWASLEELPEAPDLAIVSVPVRLALDALRAAARRKVPFVHFFTSGFSETGNLALEREMVDLTSGTGTRIVGPNCIGVLCVASRLNFSVGLSSRFRDLEPGSVAFAGQSGGVSLDFVSLAVSRRLGLNKAVSFGNQIDLRVADFLEHFAHDDSIRVVAAYVEDVKNGRAFLEALSRASRKKLVVFLKGGSTEQGARAAGSHTGALAGSHDVFAAAVRQGGGVEVQTLEQLADVVMLATTRKLPRGSRLGFVCAGGGTSVLFSDLAQRQGLCLPVLGDRTREHIGRTIPEVNTSVANPVDLGAFGLDPRFLASTVQAIGADENVDVVVPYLSLEFISQFGRQHLDEGIEALLAVARELDKPVVPVVTRFAEDDLASEEVRVQILSRLRDGGLPAYATMWDAVNSIRAVLGWQGRNLRTATR